MTGTNTKEIICLGCPNGCHIECTRKKNGEVEVAGEKCKRGIDYARQELLDPRRMVTAVVRTDSASTPFLPVKTTHPLPKALISDLLNTIYTVQVALPVKTGDPVLKNFRDTGIGTASSSMRDRRASTRSCACRAARAGGTRSTTRAAAPMPP